MPARELADRKRKLVTDLNSFINQKKQYSSTEDGRNELLAGAGAPGQEAAAPQGPDGEHSPLRPALHVFGQHESYSTVAGVVLLSHLPVCQLVPATRSIVHAPDTAAVAMSSLESADMHAFVLANFRCNQCVGPLLLVLQA